MANAFDPYHKWLGISPKDQPPNHYRLLGIELFENDPDVIEGAADQRMAHVRTFQAGQNSALSQRLLNELSAAKLCLLNPQKKADYDRQLREAVAVGLPPSPAIPPAPIPRPVPQRRPVPVEPAVPPVVSPAGPAASVHKRLIRKPPLWRQPAVLGTVGAAAIFVGLAVYLMKVEGGSPVTRGKGAGASPATTVGKIDPPTDTDDAAPDKTPSVVTEPVLPTISRAASPQPDFEIIDASWGAGESWANVTDAVRGLVKEHRLMMMVWPNLLGSPEDPAAGTPKSLRLEYRSRGREHTVQYPQHYFVYLDGNPLASPTDSPDELELLEARYGALQTYVDVLPQLQTHLRGGRLSASADLFYQRDFVPDGWQAGDWANAVKVLWVRYRNRTGEHFSYAWDYQTMTIESRLPEAAGAPVDLLRQIEPGRDAVVGKWRFDGADLIVPGRRPRLEIPVRPPEEYALIAVCEGNPEARDIGAGLVVGGRQVLAFVDGFSGTTSGLSLVDGVQGNENPTGRFRCGRILEQGRPNTLIYIVRRNSVRVLRDGAELVRWSGDPASLALLPGWEVRDSGRLFLWGYGASYRISKLNLLPLAPAKSPMLVNLAPGQPVDLLKSIDLDRDSLRDDWQFDGQSLVSPATDNARIQLPAVVTGDYKLEVVAQRESGNDGLSFTLPIAGAQTSLLLDGFNGKLSGLQPIDDKNIAANETKRESEIFADGRPKSLAITVRKNRVQVVCEGMPLVDWTGNVSRLKAWGKAPYKDRIYLGDWNSRYRLTKIELTPLDAAAESPAALAGPRVDVLKQIDVERDAVKGDWQMTDGELLTPDAPYSRLMLSPPPAPEYQLTIAGERVKGNWGLAVALVVDGRQVLAEIDGENGHFAGLNRLDGKNCKENETSRPGRILVDGKPATIIYTVRRRRIHVSVDGQTIIDWRGDPSRLSMHEGYKLPDAARLALCEYKTFCRITKIELAPLAPQAGSAPPSAMAKTTAGLLKVFEDEPDFVDALNSGEGEAELARNEVYSGKASAMVSGKQRFCEALPGLNVQIRKKPAAPNEYRYLRFAWRKRGGQQIWLQLHYPGNWHRYFAGSNSGDWVGVRVADEAPREFVEVTRDLAADFGEFTLTGLSLTPRDGECAWFDHVYLGRTLEDFSHIEASPGKRPARKFADLAPGKAALLPAPDEAAQKKFKQELLKTLAAAKTPAQKRELAQRFIGQAAETGQDASAAFVRLREAAELAEAAGDLDLAWRAIDATAERYAVDSLALRQLSLTETGKNAKSSTLAYEMAEAACRLTAAALAAEQPALVKKVASQAQGFAKRVKDAALIKEIGSRMRDAGKLAAELEAVSAARETLKSQPDDAQANSIAGRYAICTTDNWEKGLPLLAKGDDAAWNKLAQDDLALSRENATVEQQFALADGWLALAGKEAWPGRHYLRCRAVEWLRRALPSLSGKTRAQAEQRLKTLLAADDGLPDWRRFDVQGGQQFDGYLRLDKGGALRTPVEYDGPVDVTFVARTDSLNIRLYAYNQDAVVWNWEVKPSELRLRRPNGEDMGVPVIPLLPDRWYTFRYVATPQSMTITVDGAIVFTENRVYGAFPRSTVSVHGEFGSIVDVKKLVVKPL